MMTFVSYQGLVPCFRAARKDQPSQGREFLSDHLETQTGQPLDLSRVRCTLAHHDRKDLGLHVGQGCGRLLGHRGITVLASS